MHDSVRHGDQAVDDWDRHWLDFSAAAELSPATRYRRRLAMHLLSDDRRDGPVRMLEIGSGAGQFAAEFLADAPHAQFLGLELSRTGVDLASRRVPAARFLQRDLLAPIGAGSSLPDGLDFRATHALCSDVLEHLDDPGLLLRHAAAYMAPGCSLVATVPGGWFSAFYSHIGGAAAAQLFQGKWLKAPTTSGELASLASLTNLGKLLAEALASSDTLVKGPTTTIAGQQVVELKDTTKNGSLYVATTGPPYPIEIVKRGSEAGHLLFSRWNEPVTLTAPAGAIDLSQLQHAG